MVTGMAVSFFSISLHLTKFGNYYYSAIPIFKFDYSMFYNVGLTIKLPLTFIERIMNFGIAMYLLAVPLFVYEFTNYDQNKKQITVLLILVIYNFCFYDPYNAYLSYISFNNTTEKIYANCIFILHQINRLWLLAYLLYPLFLLIRHFRINTMKFIKKQIALLGICLGIMNTLFYCVFFLGPFMMSADKAVTTGFWIFENIQIVFYRYYLVIPLVTVLTLLIVLLSLLNYRMGTLVTIFTIRHLQKNITRMNDVLSDTLHNQKNLLFSLSIMAKQAFWETKTESVIKMTEIIDSSLAQTSQMLDNLRDIRYQFKLNDMIANINEALKKNAAYFESRRIQIIFDSQKYDRELLNLCFDSFHMMRVFINLFNNAVEAIEAVNREQGFIHIDIAVQFQWIFIIIEDNGVGIERTALKNLFKPFSSGKAGGPHWGLGISYAHKVINAHWGYLRIESKYGTGTTVQIMLPRIRKRKAG
jgi:signal transduction histidine kinase